MMEGCANQKFNVCLSCTDYCSACDTQMCPNHPDGFEETGIGYYLADKEQLRDCSLHGEAYIWCRCQQPRDEDLFDHVSTAKQIDLADRVL